MTLFLKSVILFGSGLLILALVGVVVSLRVPPTEGTNQAVDEPRDSARNPGMNDENHSFEAMLGESALPAAVASKRSPSSRESEETPSRIPSWPFDRSTAFPGPLSFVLEDHAQLDAEKETWQGHLGGESGSFFVVTRVAEVVDVYLNSTTFGEWSGQGVVDGALLLERLPLEDGFCGAFPTSPGDDSVPAPAAFGSAAPDIRDMEAVDFAVDDPVIDVLFLYTDNAVTALGSLNALEARAQSAIASFNGLSARSGAAATLRMSGMMRVADYPTTGVDNLLDGEISAGFERLRNKGDGFIDNIDALRAFHGADLVSLLINEDLTNDGGRRVYGLAQLKGPFSCNHASTVSGVAPHEWGHNFGCGHNGADAPAGSRAGADLRGTADYSQAHFFEYGGETRGTIMSYVGKRFSHFSNPDGRWNDQPTGTITRDHARTIDDNAATIAAWMAEASDFGLDSDKDGFSDAIEMLLGTDEDDPGSFLFLDADKLGSAASIFLLEGKRGLKYCFYRTTDPTTGDWELLKCEGPLERDKLLILPKGTPFPAPYGLFFRVEVHPF